MVFDACKIPETVAHFLLISPTYHAQRGTLLANLKKIGIMINTTVILRNPRLNELSKKFFEKNVKSC